MITEVTGVLENANLPIARTLSPMVTDDNEETVLALYSYGILIQDYVKWISMGMVVRLLNF
jgi:hypothetical protein